MVLREYTSIYGTSEVPKGLLWKSGCESSTGGFTLIFLWTTVARGKKLFFSASKTRNWINIKLIHKKLLNHASENTLRLIKRLTG